MPRAKKQAPIPEYKYAQCRGIAHAWNVEFFGKATDAPIEMPHSKVYRHWSSVLQLSCYRCPVIREDFYREGTKDPNEFGALVYRRYRNRETYAVKGGMTRSQAKKLLFRQLNEEGPQ